MNLIFEVQRTVQKGKTPVDVILKQGKVTYREKVESTDEVLERLDKILKKNRIDIKAIRSVKIVDKFLETSYTSRRILKSVEKALKIGSQYK